MQISQEMAVFMSESLIFYIYLRLLYNKATFHR